jgi:hypothetical protein
MGCSSLAELAKDLKAIKVDLSGASPDFSKSSEAAGGDDRPLGGDGGAGRARGARRRDLGDTRGGAREWHRAGFHAGALPRRAAGKWEGKTVPGDELARLDLPTSAPCSGPAKELDSKLFIFEQAVGEAIYAAQPPAEYTAAVLAAAYARGHQGPVFMQADHDQVNASAYLEEQRGGNRQAGRHHARAGRRRLLQHRYRRLDRGRSLAADGAGAAAPQRGADRAFHAIRARHRAQGRHHLARRRDRRGRAREHHARRAARVHGGLREELAAKGKALVPVSKISINTGTYHGGKMQPDGKLADVTVDYELLKTISDICRADFNMSGAVQHGASTLPGHQLAKFPGTGAVETHLALGFTNLTFDHPSCRSPSPRRSGTTLSRITPMSAAKARTICSSSTIRGKRPGR